MHNITVKYAAFVLQTEARSNNKFELFNRHLDKGFDYIEYVNKNYNDAIQDVINFCNGLDVKQEKKLKASYLKYLSRCKDQIEYEYKMKLDDLKDEKDWIEKMFV